jgi:hypothetical protein
MELKSQNFQKVLVKNYKLPEENMFPEIAL